MTMSSITMEAIAVSKAMIWLEAASATLVCLFSNPLSMLRQGGCEDSSWMRGQQLDKRTVTGDEVKAIKCQFHIHRENRSK